MKKKIAICMVLAFALSIILSSASFAAGKESFGTKVKNFWRNLIGYPARVTEESASVVADAGKESVNIVTKEVKKAAEVTSGDLDKTKELVTEPITGTAETTVKAVEGTVKIPSEALKEKTEPPQTENK